MAIATSGPIQLTDDLPGRVAPVRVAEIRAQVSGIVQRRMFAEGALVREGQPLFQINVAPFKAEADSASAALRRAEVIRDQARIQLDRLNLLLEADAVSRQAFDNAEGALAEAEAEVGVANANLARRKLDVGFATITSPISGRIGISNVTEGALVGQNDANPLATVLQTTEVYVDVSQPATRFASLREAGGQGPESVQILDAGGLPLGLTGRLLFSEMVVDPGTANMKARIVVDNASQKLIPGMFVRARLARGPEKLLPRIPQQAVVFAGGKPQVMVVAQDNTAQVRDVEVGDVVENQYVVVRGIRAGESVVVEGRDRVMPAMPVQATPWQPAAASAEAKR